MSSKHKISRKYSKRLKN